MRDFRHHQKALPLPANTSRSVTLEGRDLIIASSAGALYLYENRCPHTGETLAPLGGSVSEAEGSLLRCQRHGAEFLAATGECVSGPCQGERLTAVPFTAVDEEIYLD